MTEIDPTLSTRSTVRSRIRRRGRWWSAAATTSLAVVVLAGCGGSDTVASVEGSAQAGSGSGNTDMQAYQECLADHGVELPDMGNGGPPQDGGAPAAGALPEGGAPAGAPAGADREAFAAAQKACADLAPAGGAGGGTGQGGPNSEEFQAYTDCLTEHGVELTQPDAGSTADGQPPAGGPGGLANLDESDPGVAACADLQPDFSGGPGGAPGQQGTDTTTTTVAST